VAASTETTKAETREICYQVSCLVIPADGHYTHIATVDLSGHAFQGWICCPSLAGVPWSNPATSWTPVSCECFQIEVSVCCWSIVQSSLPTMVCLTEC